MSLFPFSTFYQYPENINQKSYCSPVFENSEFMPNRRARSNLQKDSSIQPSLIPDCHLRSRASKYKPSQNVNDVLTTAGLGIFRTNPLWKAV